MATLVDFKLTFDTIFMVPERCYIYRNFFYFKMYVIQPGLAVVTVVTLALVRTWGGCLLEEQVTSSKVRGKLHGNPSLDA